MNGKKRINQLTYMYSHITKKSMEESKKIILDTKVGRGLSVNDKRLMYEQQTANLYEIFQEINFKKNIDSADLHEKITNSLFELYKYEKDESKSNVREYSAIKIDENNNVAKKLKKVQLRILKEKQQNMINARRIEHANKIKG